MIYLVLYKYNANFVKVEATYYRVRNPTQQALWQALQFFFHPNKI